MNDAASPKTAKRKAMIYVPPEIHRAMEFMAIERNCSVSDLYSKAARAFLKPGAPGPLPPGSSAHGPVQASSAPAADALLTQILLRLDDLTGGRESKASTSSAPVEARAVAVTLDVLTRAGPKGVQRESLIAILANEGFSRVTGVGVIQQLREFGLVASKHFRLTLRHPAVLIPDKTDREGLEGDHRVR